MNHKHQKPRNRFFLPKRKPWLIGACGGLTALSLISGTLLAQAGTDPYKLLQADISNISAAQEKLENYGPIKNADQLAAYQGLVEQYVTLVKGAAADAAAYQTVLDNAAAENPDKPAAAKATNPAFSEFLAAALAYQNLVNTWVAENEAIIKDNQAKNAQYEALSGSANTVKAAADALNAAAKHLESVRDSLNNAVANSKVSDWVGKDGKPVTYQVYVTSFIPTVESALAAYQSAAESYISAVGQYRTDFKAADEYAKKHGLELKADVLSDEKWHKNYFAETYESVTAAITAAQEAIVSSTGMLFPYYSAAYEAFENYNAALEAENSSKDNLAQIVQRFPIDSSVNPAKIAGAAADLDAWIADYTAAYSTLQQRTSESLKLRKAYRSALSAYLEAGANDEFFVANNNVTLDDLGDDANYDSLVYLTSLQNTGGLNVAPNLNIAKGSDTTPDTVAGSGAVINAVNLYLANMKETTLFDAAASAWDTLDKSAQAADAALHKSFATLLDEQDIMMFRAELQSVMSRLSDTSNNPNVNQLTQSDIQFLLQDLIPSLRDIIVHVSDPSRQVKPTAAEIAKQFEAYKVAGAAYNKYSNTQTFSHTDKDDNGYTGLYAPLQALDNEYRQMGQPSLSGRPSATSIETLTRNTLAGWVEVFYDYVANNAGVKTDDLYQNWKDTGTISDKDWQTYLDRLEAAFPDKPANAAPAASKVPANAKQLKPVFTMAAFVVNPVADTDNQKSILSEHIWHDTQVIYGTSYPHYEFNFPTYAAKPAPGPGPLPTKLETPAYLSAKISPLEGPQQPEIYFKVKTVGHAKVYSEITPVPPLPKAPKPPVVVGVGLNANRAPLTRTGVNVVVLFWTLTAAAAGLTTFAYRSELTGLTRRSRGVRSTR